MYQKRSDGTYRMRASFRVTAAQVEGLNVICRKTGLCFADVCSKAVDIAIEKYVQNGEFVHPDTTPLLTENTHLAAL